MLPNSTSGLGRERVSGLNRVPNPPTRIKAFIWLARENSKRAQVQRSTMREAVDVLAPPTKVVYVFVWLILTLKIEAMQQLLFETANLPTYDA